MNYDFIMIYDFISYQCIMIYDFISERLEPLNVNILGTIEFIFIVVYFIIDACFYSFKTKRSKSDEIYFVMDEIERLLQMLLLIVALHVFYTGRNNTISIEKMKVEASTSRDYFDRSMQAQQEVSVRLEKDLVKAREDLQMIYAKEQMYQPSSSIVEGGINNQYPRPTCVNPDTRSPSFQRLNSGSIDIGKLIDELESLEIKSEHESIEVNNQELFENLSDRFKILSGLNTPESTDYPEYTAFKN